MIQLVPITALYASLCAVLVIALAWQVVERRRDRKVGLGDGGDDSLARAIRVHANAVEYLPTALLLLLLLELNGVSPILLHILGSALLVARVLHAWGLGRSRGLSFGRFYGTAVTWLVILGAAMCNLYLLLA